MLHKTEIFGFQKWLNDKKLPTGEPLQAIRIVFPDKTMADREKRPLLDVGCNVLYYDDSGVVREAV